MSKDKELKQGQELNQSQELKQGQEQKGQEQDKVLRRKQELEVIKSAIQIRELLDREGIYYKVVGGNKLRLYSLKTDEKNPSLFVFLDKNRWHDYSYGQGGSVIDFYMYMYDVDYATAVKDLRAMLRGYEFKRRPVKLNDFNQAKIEFMNLMHNYVMNLKEGKTGYLRSIRYTIEKIKEDIAKEVNRQMMEEMGLTEKDLQQEDLQEEGTTRHKIRGHIKREEEELEIG